ncbi:hypothetical protein DEI95_11250 [Curtobacterium sp. MCBD17_008]|nr:hypothetical protein DEI95_11250 [Curtobacterium sp. MCBD17_008]
MSATSRSRHPGSVQRRDGQRRDGPRRDGPRRDGPRRDGPRRDAPSLIPAERRTGGPVPLGTAPPVRPSVSAGWARPGSCRG